MTSRLSKSRRHMGYYRSLYLQVFQRITNVLFLLIETLFNLAKSCVGSLVSVDRADGILEFWKKVVLVVEYHSDDVKLISYIFNLGK